jgi:hypothetical protein
LSNQIEIPTKNLSNIAEFPEEPGPDLIYEIREHVRNTGRPETWRGHSHTKPDKGTLVVYCDEFNVPAPDSIDRVAPCPCCNPNTPQYKNRGKIAWFPGEAVIRLIGPQCFKSINEAGHKNALIELLKKQKARAEVATIALHAAQISVMLTAANQVAPIANALDDLRDQLQRVLDHDLGIPLWREVKGGELQTSELLLTPVRRLDGSIKRVDREIFRPYARIQGYGMIDRSSPISAQAKITALCKGLLAIQHRLEEVGGPSRLDEHQRSKFADMLPRARTQLLTVLAGTLSKQTFLTTDAIEVLDAWGRHPNAPYYFRLERKGTTLKASGIALPFNLAAMSEVPVLPDISHTPA